MIGPINRRLLRLRLWLFERLQWSDLPSTLFWAGLVGFGGGLLSVVFRSSIHGVQWLLTQHVGSLVHIAMGLPSWERLFMPAVGGLISGTVLYFGIRLTRSQKTSDYMEAMVVSDGVIGVRTTTVKCLSSLFTIASGGSVGREGPMVTLAAMLASWIGRMRRFSTPRLKLLVACGASAGIAAAYNAPIAAALFVAEIILGTIAMEMFGPLVFSSVVSTVTVHQILGARPTYVIPAFHLVSNWEFFFYILLGLAAGCFSPLFLGLLSHSETLFSKMRLPAYWRMGLGGVIVGIISVQRPEVWGNGYSVVNSILHQDWLWSTLLLVLICKLLATGATVGSGAVGGVFTPTLFVGAAIGCLYGKVVHHFCPGFTTLPGGYALVGMGCFLAATTQAPIMAILMIFELTLQYDVVLPLMLGCVSAYFMAKSLGQDSIYAHHLKRKREEQHVPAHPKPLHVHDLMKTDPPCVAPTASFGEIAAVFSTHRLHYVYVVEEGNRFAGVVSLHEMKPYLNEPDMARMVLAIDFMREDFPVLTPEQSIGEALGAFSRHEGERIPVINNERERKLIGIVSKTDLLLALAENAATPIEETHPATA